MRCLSSSMKVGQGEDGFFALSIIRGGAPTPEARLPCSTLADLLDVGRCGAEAVKSM